MFLNWRHGIGCGVKVLQQYLLSDSCNTADNAAGPYWLNAVLIRMPQFVIPSAWTCQLHRTELAARVYGNAAADAFIGGGVV